VLQVAKLYTFLYAMVMIGCIVGAIDKVVKDFTSDEPMISMTTLQPITTPQPNAILPPNETFWLNPPPQPLLNDWRRPIYFFIFSFLFLEENISLH
jgi:hypothetical protein